MSTMNVPYDCVCVGSSSVISSFNPENATDRLGQVKRVALADWVGSTCRPFRSGQSFHLAGEGTVLIDATLGRDLTLGSPKTNRSRRTVHIPDQLRATLQTHLRRFYQPGREPDLIFTSGQSGPIRYTNWRSRVWVPATRIAGLEGVRYHDLRHAHASLLIDAGIDPVKVSRRLGHSRTSITVDRYSHLLDRDEAAILDVFRSRDADQGRTRAANVVSFDP